MELPIFFFWIFEQLNMVSKIGFDLNQILSLESWEQLGDKPFGSYTLFEIGEPFGQCSHLPCHGLYPCLQFYGLGGLGRFAFPFKCFPFVTC